MIGTARTLGDSDSGVEVQLTTAIENARTLGDSDSCVEVQLTVRPLEVQLENGFNTPHSSIQL